MKQDDRLEKEDRRPHAERDRFATDIKIVSPRVSNVVWVRQNT